VNWSYERLADFLDKMARPLIRDPDFWIRMYRSGWEKTASPVYAWQAVAVCTEHKKPFPDWVMGYLAVVAKRMASDDARAAKDLRAVLPGIMGFPAKPSGPSRPLDPSAQGKNYNVLLLKLLFASAIEEGREPSEALDNALASLPSDIADRDDKTLWRWLMLDLDLKRKPSTNAEWKTALRVQFGSFLAFMENMEDKVSRDSGLENPSA
jgi:hypothetical protein